MQSVASSPSADAPWGPRAPRAPRAAHDGASKYELLHGSDDDSPGMTPLQEAAFQGDAERLSALLAPGPSRADLMAVVVSTGCTALHLAVEASSLECVRLLAGAYNRVWRPDDDRTLKNNDGESPLDLAMFMGMTNTPGSADVYHELLNEIPGMGTPWIDGLCS